MADNKIFGEIQSHAKALQDGYSRRNSDFKTYEDMILLNPSGLPSKDWIKQTISPDARNSLIGPWRLLSATDPKWSLPGDVNDPDTKKVASDVEKFCAAVWSAAGRIAGKPIHSDIAFSSLLYSEVHVPIITTQSLVKMASKKDRARAEEVARRTPLLFDVINPKLGFPEFDRYGLAAYYTSKEISIAEIKSMWGDAAEKQLEGQQSTKKITYNEYWNSEYHAVWIAGSTEPIYLEEHGLPLIPIACGVVEGGNLFEKIEDTRQPLLYGLRKSGLWERQNLALTAMYSNVFALASTGTFVYKRNAPDKRLQRDFDEVGGLIAIDNNEDFGPLAKNAIDPSMQHILELAEQKISESTIYRQTLGEPIGSNATYSMTALLSQSGRLPLVPYQRMCSHVIGNAMYIGLRLLQLHGNKHKMNDRNEVIELDISKLPKAFELEAELKVNMPQDDRQNAAVALQLKQARLMSDNAIMEKFLDVGQPDQMVREIWEQDAAEAQHQMDLQMEMQKRQAAMQQKIAQQQQVEMMQQQQMQQPPMPPQGPPEMAGGGLQPGQGAPPMPMNEPMAPPGQQGMNPMDMMSGMIPPEEGGM